MSFIGRVFQFNVSVLHFKVSCRKKANIIYFILAINFDLLIYRHSHIRISKDAN